jgi:putative endonuclease
MTLFNQQNSREFGSQLEAFAADQLRQKGCEVVATNFQSKFGEIDLIVKHGKTLVFVEVRYRKSNAFGGASYSVDQIKQQKLIKTASLYLQLHQLTNNTACRFDVFAIEGKLNHLSYNWIESAFTA